MWHFESGAGESPTMGPKTSPLLTKCAELQLSVPQPTSSTLFTHQPLSTHTVGVLSVKEVVPTFPAFVGVRCVGASGVQREAVASEVNAVEVHGMSCVR